MPANQGFFPIQNKNISVDKNRPPAGNTTSVDVMLSAYRGDAETGAKFE
jgi:hypothetical protein